MHNRDAVLIVNTQARNGEKYFKEAKKILTQSEINLARSYNVKHSERITKIIDRSIKDGYKLIIVGGGDGTISSVVDFFAFKDVVLGILPLGTANSFARTLGIPLTLKGSIDVILKGKVSMIDLGKIGDDYFANTANIGLSCRINKAQIKGYKRFFGRLAYIFPAIASLFNFKPFNTTFTFKNGTQKSFNCIEILIANGQFQGGLKLAPEAELDNQKICLSVIKAGIHPVENILRFWIYGLFGKKLKHQSIENFRTDYVHIQTDTFQYIDIDGEISTQTPAEVSVAPQSLKIIIP